MKALLATVSMAAMMLMAAPADAGGKRHDGYQRDSHSHGYHRGGKKGGYDRDRRHRGKHRGRRGHHGKHHHDKPEPKPEPVAATPERSIESRDQSPRIGPGQPTEHLYGVQDGMKYNVYVFQGGVSGLFTPESKRAVSLLSSGAARLSDMDLEPAGKTSRGDTIWHMSAPRSDAADMPFTDWLSTAW